MSWKSASSMSNSPSIGDTIGSGLIREHYPTSSPRFGIGSSQSIAPIDLALFGISSIRSQIESGKLRAYVIAAPERSPMLPNVPSADEAGLRGFEVRSWFGMFAPAKTPPAIIDRLSREIQKASSDPKFIAALAPQGMQILASTPDEMAQAMREDAKKWGDLIRETGVTINQ